MSNPSAAVPASLRVLVADDDPTACATIADLLTACGHTVVARAASGAEAVSHAMEHAPDAVLLDVRMPNGSGLDAALVIGRMTPPPAVVLFTGHAELAFDADTLLATPAAAVLPKPTPRGVLDATLRCAVARGRERTAAVLDAERARRQLEERKLIERAKGILMRRTGCSEPEAYRILQRSSQDKATPMAVLARAVLDSEPGAATVS